MLETKEQKQYFFTVVILVLVLTVISLWNRGGFKYVEQPKPVTHTQFDAEAYLKYLAAIQVNAQASKEAFEKIITPEDIQKQVESELGTTQAISQPTVETTAVVLEKDTGKTGVVDYLARSAGLALQFGTQVKTGNGGLFTGNTDSALTAEQHYESFSKELAALKTPPQALELQKRLMAMYEAYGRLLESSRAYAEGRETEPWQNVYKAYVVVNEQVKQYTAELNRLNNQYNLADAYIVPYYVAKSDNTSHPFVKTANALFGLGDITITVGDIPRIVKEAVEEGLISSFTQFSAQFLEKVISKIESNYKIANFLYYSDALIAGQYTDDYLQKYVADNLDRQIIKKFIPQLTCGQQPVNLQPIFKAKAQEYLGFDPTSIDPNDPDYYVKMSRVGSYLASPTGWESYYQDLAQQAQSEAEKAAERELTSNGLKTPRDTLKNSIAVSVSNIVSAQKASLEALLGLGNQTSKNFISGMVSQLTQTLVNKFVFNGAISNTSSLGVLKEQSTCLAAAQLQLVLPVSDTVYNPPAPAPDPNDILLQECAKYPRGCQLQPTTGIN